MRTVTQGPVRAKLIGGDVVDFEIVAQCSRQELQIALAGIADQYGAVDHDFFETPEDYFE